MVGLQVDLRDKGDLLIGAMSRSHIFEVPGVDFINLLKADRTAAKLCFNGALFNS